MLKKVQRYSPLTEASYYILLSLINPLHGYGVIKKVEEMSYGRVRLAAGTLYGALSAMLENKIIMSIGEDEKNKRRKMYQITEFGNELLKYEIGRLQEMLKNGTREVKG